MATHSCPLLPHSNRLLSVRHCFSGGGLADLQARGTSGAMGSFKLSSGGGNVARASRPNAHGGIATQVQHKAPLNALVLSSALLQPRPLSIADALGGCAGQAAARRRRGTRKWPAQGAAHATEEPVVKPPLAC